MTPKRCNDLDSLVEPFRLRVELVVEHLRALRFDPVVFETLRTPERSRWLVKTGKSKSKGLSMHCFGVAADIICGQHQWSCHLHDCSFFQELGAAAEDHGLVWGGRWRSIVDLPHIQAVPVSAQREVRAAKSEAEILAIVERYLQG